MLFTDVSKTVSQSKPSGLVQFLMQAFQATQQMEEITSIPTLLIPSSVLVSPQQTTSVTRIEKRVLDWFSEHGFDGMQDMKSGPHFYPLAGYPRLLEELVEIIDTSAQKEHDIMFQGVKQLVLEDIEARGDWDDSLKEGVKNLHQRVNGQLPCLKHVIESEEVIENLHTAVVHSDAEGYPECQVADGAPDLFLWYPDPTYHLWFFAEVKKGEDSLRASQFQWIRRFWKDVCGRVAILHVD